MAPQTAPQSAVQSVVSVVGGGQGLVAPQYVAPPTVTAATLAAAHRPIAMMAAAGSRSSEAPEQATSGLPRGADMYSAVYDGVPAARMEPPASARPRGAAPQRER